MVRLPAARFCVFRAFSPLTLNVERFLATHPVPPVYQRETIAFYKHGSAIAKHRGN